MICSFEIPGQQSAIPSKSFIKLVIEGKIVHQQYSFWIFLKLERETREQNPQTIFTIKLGNINCTRNWRKWLPLGR